MSRIAQRTLADTIIRPPIGAHIGTTRGWRISFIPLEANKITSALVVIVTIPFTEPQQRLGCWKLRRLPGRRTSWT